MCGRYLLTDFSEILAERFKVSDIPGGNSPHYNVSPTQVMPVIVRDGRALRHLDRARWAANQDLHDPDLWAQRADSPDPRSDALHPEAGGGRVVADAREQRGCVATAVPGSLPCRADGSLRGLSGGHRP